MAKYQYTPFTSRIKDCEVIIIRGGLHYEGEPEAKKPEDMGLTLIASRCNDGWGHVKSHDMMSDESWPMPNWLSLRYLTMNEGQCYDIETQLDDVTAEELWTKQEREHPQDPFADYVVGTAPFGFIAVWLQGHTRSVLLQTFYAKEAQFAPIEEQMFSWIKETGTHEVISRKELEYDMQQFCYRYVALEEYWDMDKNAWDEYADDDVYYDNLDVDSIEDIRTDGTFNFMEGDEEQMKFHTTGKPYRITIQWHAGNTEFLAHYWIRKGVITHFFNRFSEMFPDRRIELLLRLDPRSQAYGFAFRAEGSKTAYPILMDAFQLVVFKDDVEHFKSPGYCLEPGEWSWDYKPSDENEDQPQQ